MNYSTMRTFFWVTHFDLLDDTLDKFVCKVKRNYEVDMRLYRSI